MTLPRKRQPKSKWEKFLFLFCSSRRWARRLLGGKWEAYVHDMGSFRFMVVWYWVSEFGSPFSGAPLLGKEEFLRGGKFR